jgi:hypothetical protein
MANNEDPFSEALQLKKAKKRLLGAAIIFIFLLLTSYFFLDDRSQYVQDSLKISFVDSEPDTLDEIIDSKSQDISLSNFFIQVGVFSDENKSQNLLNKINKLDIGIVFLIDNINVDNKSMFRVKTDIYNNLGDAEKALNRLKDNDIDGIIQNNNS